ncbi:MAG TPA: glycosyltransferase [Candidatus Thermoplasmatota archaeon]|nr:glycosyltransferase [Candidatus Thermoplasmatota archaeon]
MVTLHSLDAKAAAGVTRYARELAEALRLAGEPVQELRIRPYELSLGQRRVGGFLSMKAQGLVRPLLKRGVLHSTFHYAAHPRCDVATVHDLFPETRSEELGFAAVEVAAMRRTTARLLRRKVRLVCDSEATRSTFMSLYPDADPRLLHVVMPGISGRFRPPPLDRPRPHPAFRPDRFNVLCVADLNPRKRFDWLLQAVLAVGDPAVQLLHAGPDTVRRPPWAQQKDLESPLEATLGSRLTRLGRLDDADLVAAYQSADLLVLPTLDEGFGFPPLEALGCGTPVAVTDLPVFRETLPGQGDRFSDAASLAKVLREAVARGTPTPSQRAARNEWVKEQHSWDNAARTLRDLYRGRLASR